MLLLSKAARRFVIRNCSVALPRQHRRSGRRAVAEFFNNLRLAIWPLGERADIIMLLPLIIADNVLF